MTDGEYKVIEVPDEIKESFSIGDIFVCVKDKNGKLVLLLIEPGLEEETGPKPHMNVAQAYLLSGKDENKLKKLAEEFSHIYQ